MPGTLSVAEFETSRLLLKDIRVPGNVRARMDSLNIQYVFADFPHGKILSLEAENLRLAKGEHRAIVHTITGQGSFTLGIGGFRSLRTDLEILRAFLGSEPIHPSRLTVAYHDDALTVESAFLSDRGHVALFGKGHLTEDAPPYHVTVSGRLDPAILPFMHRESASREAVSFSINSEIEDLHAAIDSFRQGDGSLPERFSVDGEIALDLGRISFGGHAIGAPGQDRARFRLENVTVDGAVTQGRVTLDLDIAPRRGRTTEFARAKVTFRADVNRNGDALTIAIHPGSEGRIFDLRNRNGLRLDGETVFRLADADNRIVFDMKGQTARHRLRAQVTRHESKLRLQSEGDLSAPENPVVFTLQGKIDPAPLLALIPNVSAVSGQSEIFVAGEATGLLAPRQPHRQNTAPSPVLRIDGAATLQVKGLAVAGTEKIDAATDHATLTLKAFKATRSWRQGKFALVVKMGPRRIGETTLSAINLSTEGQLRSTDAGYRIRLEPGGDVSFGNIRSPLLTLQNQIRLELAGNKNTINTDKQFRPIAANFRFADFEAAGALTKRFVSQTSFRLKLPRLTASVSKKGIEWRGAGGTLTLPKLAVASQGVSLTAQMSESITSAAFKARDVRHRARRPVMSPVALSAKMSINAGIVSAKVRATQFASPLAFDAALEHDYRSNSGRLRLATPLFAMKGARHQFGDIFPVAIGWFDTIQGAAAANAELNWDRDLMSGRATFTLDRINFAIQDLHVSGMSGAVNFIELSPLITPPRQRLTGNLAFADLGPLPFRAEFQLNEDGRVAVQDLDIAVAGGRTRTRGIVSVGEAGLTAQGEVEATSIALGDAFHILGIDGLEGNGRLSGVLPIALRNNVAQIKDGRLTADAPGLLQYGEGSLEQQLIGPPEQKASAIKALSEFRFKTLDVALENSSAESGSIRLRLRGTNPSIYEGAEFSMDMQVVSDMRRLERLVLGGLHTASDISRQADSPKPRR